MIKDILETVSEDKRGFVEREVYIYVLKMARAMCEGGKKLLADYSGFKELFDLGKGMKALDEIMEYTRHEWGLCQVSGVPYTEEDCKNYYTEMFMR